MILVISVTRGTPPDSLLHACLVTCRLDFGDLSYAPSPEEDAPMKVLLGEMLGAASKMQAIHTKQIGNLILLLTPQQFLPYYSEVR